MKLMLRDEVEFGFRGSRDHSLAKSWEVKVSSSASQVIGACAVKPRPDSVK